MRLDTLPKYADRMALVMLSVGLTITMLVEYLLK